MLSWSINLFRIRGIQLAIHSTFFLLLAWRGYEGWTSEGAFGFQEAVLITLAIFVCVVLHELGHSFTGMHFGMHVSRILLMPIGGMAQFDEIPKIPRQELLITIAGPAVNAVIAAVLFGLALLKPAFLVSGPVLINNLFWDLLYANVAMLVLNLLPIFPMDGGRILRALLAYRLPYLRATYWASIIGKVLAVIAAAGWIAYGIYHNDGDVLLPAVLFLFIFRVNHQEYKMVQRNEQQEAYWREVAARVRIEPPLPKDPPILL